MFVIWGALHGVAIVLHRIWQQLGFKMNTLLAWFVTFNFINITWIFFRAKEMEDALKVLGGMFGFEALGSFKDMIQFGSVDKMTLLTIVLAFSIAIAGFFFKNSTQNLNNFLANKKIVLFSGFLLATAILFLNRISEFLYFNF